MGDFASGMMVGAMAGAYRPWGFGWGWGGVGFGGWGYGGGWGGMRRDVHCTCIQHCPLKKCFYWNVLSKVI